ncbi:MAG: SGNH/GDSL hydrolase family protein [Steroidobacteraceae bacterium]
MEFAAVYTVESLANGTRELKTLLFWLTLPWLLPQALWVRRYAPRFAAPPGPSSGCLAGEPRLKLAGIGDSIIAGVGARDMAAGLVGRIATMIATQLDCGVEWQAIGKIGATTRGVRQKLVQRLPAGPIDLFVVSVGVNDITSLRTLRGWQADVDQLLDCLHAHSPGALVLLAGIPPLQHFPLLPQPLKAVLGLRAAHFAEALAEVARRRAGCIPVPIDVQPDRQQFSADGFHPSHDAYALFAAAMMAAAMPALAQRRDCL